MTVPRIAMIARGDVFGVGGVERSVVRIARGLSASGRAEVDVIELRPDIDADLARGGIFDVEPEPMGDGVHRYLLPAWCTSPNKAEREFAVHMALVELVRRREYELLHGMYASTAGFATVYAALEHELPSVVSLRGNDIHRDVFHAQRFAQLRWALERTTAVTSVSAEALRRADIFSGCAPKGRVILNSIDPAGYADGVADRPAGSPVVGSLAKFRAKKGLAALLQAFAAVRQRHPQAHLLLAGGIVPEEQEPMARLITDSGIGDAITITGYVERVDAMRYIRAMDVFVLSSIHDGCPNALLEAMAAGAPIVATTSGAVPEMLTDGDEAVLVRPGDAAAMADGIGRLLAADTAAFGARARKAIGDRFGIDRELDEWVEVYAQCLGREGRSS